MVCRNGHRFIGFFFRFAVLFVGIFLRETLKRQHVEIVWSMTMIKSHNAIRSIIAITTRCKSKNKTYVDNFFRYIFVVSIEIVFLFLFAFYIYTKDILYSLYILILSSTMKSMIFICLFLRFLSFHNLQSFRRFTSLVFYLAVSKM